MTGEARCAKCFQRLEADATSCARCGTPVQQDVVDLRNAPKSPVSDTECPSCHHENPLSARFCESCGTQLRGIGPGGSALDPSQARTPREGAHEHAPESEDPWATGPGYQRPPPEDALCPRCGTFRNAGETACVECGLPFGAELNYIGIPKAVAMAGDPAGFWIRFVASIVDSFIVLAISIPLAILSFVVDSSISTMFDLLQFAISLLYAPVLLSLYGTTPGKKLFNIYILDETGTRPLNFGRAFVREISKILSGLIFMIGYIMAAFRADKRALHDLIAGTYPTIRHRVR